MLRTSHFHYSQFKSQMIPGEETTAAIGVLQLHSTTGASSSRFTLLSKAGQKYLSCCKCFKNKQTLSSKSTFNLLRLVPCMLHVVEFSLVWCEAALISQQYWLCWGCHQCIVLCCWKIHEQIEAGDWVAVMAALNRLFSFPYNVNVSYYFIWMRKLDSFSHLFLDHCWVCLPVTCWWPVCHTRFVGPVCYVVYFRCTKEIIICTNLAFKFSQLAEMLFYVCVFC